MSTMKWQRHASVRQLRMQCKVAGLKGYANLAKPALEKLLANHPMRDVSHVAAYQRPKELVTAEQLRQALLFDLSTGLFTWRCDRGRNGAAKAGERAGCVDRSTGYRVITISGRQYLAHRLAWLYVHDEWPPEMIDHINGVRSDNRMDNLRLASRRQNGANAKKPSHNSTGFKGVCRIQPSKRFPFERFRAYIRLGGRVTHLGFFSTAEEAQAAYAAMAHGEFGEFWRAS
jgi:hypothetical protein